jgi:GDP-L-fucose synthase
MEGGTRVHRNARVFVAGGKTLIGAALLRELASRSFAGVVGAPPDEPDYRSADEIAAFFRSAHPEYVFLAAGRSGGIRANEASPADLMLDNLLAECNVIDAAHRFGVRKLLYLASSCCYPKHCPQPMRIESLMTGPLEPTNEAYATAKIAGIRLCQAYARQHGDNFVCGIPANAFGIDDDFSAEGGHVIPALIARFHAAKVERKPSVTVWGTGTPRREFIFADDLADACLFVMDEYNDAETPINLGCGDDLSIAQTAELIREVVGYTGELLFDGTKPDGMPLKSLDSSALLQRGWRAKTPIACAVEKTYEAYRNTIEEPRRERSYVRTAV